MSLIDMINEEIYEWDMIDTHHFSKEEARRWKDCIPYSINNDNRWEHIAIIQWLYYDEKDYHNWVYNLDQITEDQKDGV